MPVSRIIYWLLLCLITGTSFYCFAAFNDPHFNSDHAVHALMARHFDWDHGAYYWGQNRLGSFLPWLASFPVTWFHAHPLYATAILNYLFLVAGFLLLCHYLENYLQKTLLAVFIFWPLTHFHVLLLIGHPYAAQFFLLTFSFYALERAGGWFLANVPLRAMAWLAGCTVAFALACWVSEFSAVFVLLHIWFCFSDREIRKHLVDSMHRKRFRTVIMLLAFGGLVYGLFAFYLWTKRAAVAHEDYERMFIRGNEITLQWKYFLEDVLYRATNGDGNLAATLFFYCCIFGIVYVLISVFRDKNDVVRNGLAGILGVSCLVLFFSSWNFRFQFDVKYFTPVYVVAVFLAVYFLSSGGATRRWTLIISVCMALCVLTESVGSVVSNDFNYNVRRDLSPFAKLKPGGLVGGYWLVYRINAFAPDNLISVPIDEDQVRNAHMIEEVFSQQRIYVIKNGFLPQAEPMPDTLRQFERILLKSGRDTTISRIAFAPYRVLK